MGFFSCHAMLTNRVNNFQQASKFFKGEVLFSDLKSRNHPGIKGLKKLFADFPGWSYKTEKIGGPSSDDLNFRNLVRKSGKSHLGLVRPDTGGKSSNCLIEVVWEIGHRAKSFGTHTLYNFFSGPLTWKDPTTGKTKIIGIVSFGGTFGDGKSTPVVIGLKTNR